jgi:hypothetical protein
MDLLIDGCMDDILDGRYMYGRWMDGWMDDRMDITTFRADSDKLLNSYRLGH